MRPEPLHRYLKISIGIHIGIAIFLVAQGVFFPGKVSSYTPSLRVDIVGLPDQLRGEKLAPSESESGASSLPKLAPLPTLKSAESGAAPPKKKTSKLEEAADAKPTSASERAKLALQRFKALHSLKARENSTGTAAPIKGNLVSKGTSLSADAKESLESNYRDVLWDHLVEHWELPSWLQGREFTATVRVWIDPTGRITQMFFQKNSGSKEFDDAVIQTLRRAQPLPSPPSDFRSLALQRGILLGFPR